MSNSTVIIISHGMREINKRDYDIIKSDRNHPNYNNVQMIVNITEHGQHVVHYVLYYNVMNIVVIN